MYLSIKEFFFLSTGEKIFKLLLRYVKKFCDVYQTIKGSREYETA